MCAGVKGQRKKGMGRGKGRRKEGWRGKGKHNGGEQKSKGGRTEWGRMGEEEEE